MYVDEIFNKLTEGERYLMTPAATNPVLRKVIQQHIEHFEKAMLGLAPGSKNYEDLGKQYIVLYTYMQAWKRLIEEFDKLAEELTRAQKIT